LGGLGIWEVWMAEFQWSEEGREGGRGRRAKLYSMNLWFGRSKE
jgi:hypothetical protein